MISATATIFGNGLSGMDNDGPSITGALPRTRPRDDSPVWKAGFRFQQHHAAANFAIASLGTQRLTNALREAQPYLGIRTDELDSRPRPTELSERNFESSNWRAATVQPRELRDKGSEARHQPDAQCPKFLQLLKQVTSENAALAGYVQRDLGYSMTAYTVEKSAFLLHGPTDTGKSTLLALFRKLLGEYAVLIPDRHADGKAGHQQHCC